MSSPHVGMSVGISVGEGAPHGRTRPEPWGSDALLMQRGRAIQHGDGECAPAEVKATSVAATPWQSLPARATDHTRRIETAPEPLRGGRVGPTDP